MPVPLVILGFLREKDYHGYELKKEIQRRMGNWTDIKFGSIYHALKKLVESGAVEKVAEEHRAGRPDRTIYRITEKGKREFQFLLKELLESFQRVYLKLDVGLYFGGNLPLKDLQEILCRRLALTEEIRKKLEEVKHWPVHQKLPRISEVIVDHSIFHLEAEEKWLEMCLSRLRQEDLFLPPQR